MPACAAVLQSKNWLLNSLLDCQLNFIIKMKTMQRFITLPILQHSTSHHYALLVLYMYCSNTRQLDSNNVCADVCIHIYLVDECSYK